MASFLESAISSILGQNFLNQGASITITGPEGSVEIPVTPPSFQVGNTYNHGTVNINNLGDITMMGKRGLKTVSFSSFFPNKQYAFVSVSANAPYEYVAEIKKMAEADQPCKLVISDTDIDMDCVITEFPYEEKDGTGDVYYTLSFREYRYIKPDSELANDVSGLNSRVTNALASKSTSFLPGNDIMDLASKATGQLFGMASQGTNRMTLFKSLAKLSGLSAGSVLNSTKNSVKIGDKTICKF